MRRRSIAVVEVTNRAIVLELASPDSRPIVLEGTAHSIWSEIDGISDTDGIVERLAAAAGLEPARIHDDVDAFLEQLEAAHIITVLADDPPSYEWTRE